MSFRVRLIPGPDPLPGSSCLHFNTILHRCYTHVSDRLLRSILKRKCNHLSIEQALERDGEGEKTHTHSCVNMLQQEERVFKCWRERFWVVQGVREGEGRRRKDTVGVLKSAGDISSQMSCLASYPAVGYYVFMWEEKQNRLLNSGVQLHCLLLHHTTYKHSQSSSQICLHKTAHTYRHALSSTNTITGMQIHTHTHTSQWPKLKHFKEQWVNKGITRKSW